MNPRAFLLPLATAAPADTLYCAATIKGTIDVVSFSK
jgi:hypothetical protein